MNINIAAICLFALLTIGCAPAVRYTREQPDGRSGNQPRRPVEQSVERQAPGDADAGADADADADASDTAQSGWEAPDGGAVGRRPGWLAAALNESVGQSPPVARESVKKGEVPPRLRQVVNSYMGVPYKYGGTTPRGFDCSGFVSAVYREVYGMPLKRTSSAMWKEGAPVALSAARPGDLVFFKGGAFGAIDHVGIYMGRTRFVHASTASGVVYGNLKETYYARRFAGVRRMF